MNALHAATEVIALGLILAGALFCLSATVGLIRFPDVYTRLHAGTKCLTAGAMLILGGVAVLEGSWAMSGRVLLIALFFLATNPIAGHAVARAAYRRSSSHPGLWIDELHAKPCTKRKMTGEA
ncbi:MAG: monovalent cation/H(+) antiporter subunit G [Patescibacteria group bacterium]|nr:monovalent cation/H(+) antiporter subunit G [Patescibacteria group bacterium]